MLATNSSLIQATSKPLAVIAGAATQLVVVGEPPASVPVFSEFGASVVAEDAEGNLANTFSGNVTVSLATSPTDAALGGTLVMAASGGVAVFSDLTLISSALAMLSGSKATDWHRVKPIRSPSIWPR